MKFLKQIPNEEITIHRLDVKFKIQPIIKEEKNTNPDYKNTTIVSRIINIKNRLSNDLLKREIEAINKAGLAFFEYLQNAENATSKDVDCVINYLQKVILILQKKKRENIINKKTSTTKLRPNQ